MALNIAVPLSGVGGLSPILPLDMDCWENIKILVSPIGSESSGVSSLDSEEAKLQQQKPTAISPVKDNGIGDNIVESKPTERVEENNIKTMYLNRNILDLMSNIETNASAWDMQYAKLPENNMVMFLANRSQYHRLGANGLTPEYRLMQCACCDFQYPINRAAGYYCQTSLNVSPTTSAMTFSTNFRVNNKKADNASTITTATAATTRKPSSSTASGSANNKNVCLVPDRNKNTLMPLPSQWQNSVESVCKSSNSMPQFNSKYTPVNNFSTNTNITHQPPPPPPPQSTTTFNNLTTLLNSLYSNQNGNLNQNQSYFQSNTNTNNTNTNINNANSFYNHNGNSSNALAANNNTQSYGMYKYF